MHLYLNNILIKNHILYFMVEFIFYGSILTWSISKFLHVFICQNYIITYKNFLKKELHDSIMRRFNHPELKMMNDNVQDWNATNLSQIVQPPRPNSLLEASSVSGGGCGLSFVFSDKMSLILSIIFNHFGAIATHYTRCLDHLITSCLLQNTPLLLQESCPLIVVSIPSLTVVDLLVIRSNPPRTIVYLRGQPQTTTHACNM
jgi:hypothetical protein